MSRYYNVYTATEIDKPQDYLIHYGRKGMHWGQHLPDILAFLTGTGRRKTKAHELSTTKRSRSHTTKAKAQKVRKESLQKAKKKTKSSAKTEEMKAKKKTKSSVKTEEMKAINDVVKHGEARDVLKVANKLTPDQQKYVLNRFQFRQSLVNYSKQDYAEKQQRAQSVIDTLDKMSTAGKRAVDIYNVGAGFYNAFSGENAKKLNLVNSNPGGGGKKKKKGGDDDDDEGKSAFEKAMNRAKNYVS